MPDTLPQAPATLGKFERYLIEEFYDDYREGALPRRAFFRRVAYITGGMATAAATLAAMGCTGKDLPHPKATIPSTSPTASPTTPRICWTSQQCRVRKSTTSCAWPPR